MNHFHSNRQRPTRDLEVLRPSASTNPWRSVRRRQRRIHRSAYRSQHSSAALDLQNVVGAVSASAEGHSEAATQTETPQLRYISTATQATTRRTSRGIQTPSPAHKCAATQTDPTPAALPRSTAELTIPHSVATTLPVIDDPLPPPPPMPQPPVEFTRRPCPIEWAIHANQLRPPGHKLDSARYSLAETTAQVIELMSPEYRSILHALVDYQHLPPFQRRALLELHRFLFPAGLKRATSSSSFALLPMVPVLFYLRTWESIMSQYVQDSAVPDNLNYQFKDGVFYRE